MEITKLRQCLGIEDNKKDIILKIIADSVDEIIMTYCNENAVPIGLHSTAYRMAMDMYRNENLGHEESAQGSISSIAEGDTSISYKSYVDEGYKDSLLKNYEPVLNRYRRVMFK